MTSAKDRRPLATPKQVSEYLTVPEETLRQWRHRSTGPRYQKVGHLVRYDWKDVDTWLAENSTVTQ